MGNGENTLHDLLVAARAYEGVRVHEARWSDILAESAAANSRRCVFLGRGGHHNWDTRFNKLKSTGLGTTYAEINAESWKRQTLNTPVQLWTEAFRCWQQSKGHWSVASVPHKYFGADLAKSKGGIWYMTIVVADGGEPLEPEEDYKLW